MTTLEQYIRLGGYVEPKAMISQAVCCWRCAAVIRGPVIPWRDGFTLCAPCRRDFWEGA